MPLTPEQIKELKAQLVSQVQHLPPDKKADALAQIESLSPQALEAMIKQQSAGEKGNKGIFRSIVDKEIPSRIIEENKDCIAVLDIKPISKGHTIIIPKKTVADAKNLPSSAFSLAKKISRRMSSKLKASGSEIQTEFKFGEMIINIIPIYDKALSLNSQRYDAKEPELVEVQNLLRAIKKPKTPKTVIQKPISPSKTLQLNRRIP